MDELLNSSTKAISGSEDAVHLIEQKERLELALKEEDPSLILDTSKAFLESIFKTILQDHESDINLDKTNIDNLCNQVQQKLVFNYNENIDKTFKRLLNKIVKDTIQKLRNDYGKTSHGDDGYFDNPLRLSEARMIAQLTDSLVAFLYTKHKETIDPKLASRIDYFDYPDFNDWLDTQYEGYELALDEQNKFYLTASKLIYQHDIELYREMLIQYRASDQEL